MDLIEDQGAGFDDGEKLDWATGAVLRRVKELYTSTSYQVRCHFTFVWSSSLIVAFQTLVSGI